MARRSSAPDFIEALARGLDVIRAFSPGDGEIGLSAIAGRAGLARPTARRILITLEEMGYVRAHEGSYALTPRVLELGMAYIQSQGLWPLFHPHLQELVRQTNESCSIAQLDGSDIVYVARVAVPKIVGLSVQIGTRFPAYATSLGKALLATLPPVQLEQVLDQPSRAQVTARWQPTRDEILRALDAVRERVWALTDEELAPGVRSVAVALRNASGEAVASVNVNASAAETSVAELVERYLPPLLATQGAIQADLARLYSLPVETVAR